jgi:hypothetical protein
MELKQSRLCLRRGVVLHMLVGVTGVVAAAQFEAVFLV